METKVILPTLMRRCYQQRDGDLTRLYETQKYDKYEFSLVEAIRYMIDNGRELKFKEMILHNVNMRNLMRKIGAKNLVEQLRELEAPNDRLDREMRSFVEKWDGKQLGDIDIQVVPTGAPFVVDGLVFDGLDGLKASVDRTCRRSSCDTVTPKATAQCHVGEVWEPYPRFDIYDSCDDRYYANYLIRRQPVLDDELKAVYSAGRCNLCAINEDTPAYLLPLVYYVGDGGFMLVAERHNPLEY